VRTEQFPAVAAELVKAQVDAILAGGAAAARPHRQPQVRSLFSR